MLLQATPTQGFYDTAYSILTYLPFLLFMFYGQKFQMWMILSNVSRSLGRLETLREKSKKELTEYVANECKPAMDTSERISQFLEYFTIMPVDLDPKGIVKKIEHLVTLQEDRIRAEVRALVPECKRLQTSAIENMVEVAATMNLLYKIVRHYYILGKRTSSMLILAQLQMMLPTVLQEADALMGAMGALKLAQPIGDGIGPMVVGRMMLLTAKETIARDTVLGRSSHKERNLYLIKAEGPNGTVGQIGRAVEALMQDAGVKIDTVIMIDAALKFEGEKTGDVAEGVGAAIGGVGVERFKIEEVATQKNIPVFAVIVKQSVAEAISVMKKEIAEAADKVAETVQRIIDEKTKAGDNILVVGVGNTLGVSQ